MNALQSVVTAIHTREAKEAGAALVVYRASVQQLAGNDPMAEKDQKKLAEAMEVLEIGTTVLAEDVAALREHVRLTAAVALAPDRDREQNQALTAWEEFTKEVDRRGMELKKRLAQAEWACLSCHEDGRNLTRLVQKNPRLFAPAEKALAKPAPKAPQPTHFDVDYHSLLLSRNS